MDVADDMRRRISAAVDPCFMPLSVDLDFRSLACFRLFVQGMVLCGCVASTRLFDYVHFESTLARNIVG